MDGTYKRIEPITQKRWNSIQNKEYAIDAIDTLKRGTMSRLRLRADGRFVRCPDERIGSNEE